jgi:hypothetical protein
MKLMPVVILASAVLAGCEPVRRFDCADTVKNEVASPGGRYIATVLERDCGATTDYSTNLVVRGFKEPLDPSGQHLVLTVEGRTPIPLEWTSDESLTVVLPSTELFTKQETWRDVRIVYE